MVKNSDKITMVDTEIENNESFNSLIRSTPSTILDLKKKYLKTKKLKAQIC